MTIVSDYTALLRYTSAGSENTRWNSQAALGTQTVVTYSFTETADLADVSGDPYGASSYWAFDSTQRGYFRQAAEAFEDAAGLLFVEVDSPAMINIFGFTGGTAGGWANYAWATEYSTGQGDLAMGSSGMAPGSYGYETLLHELGHAMGLKHPHDGDPTLEAHLDTQHNTVMTYNRAGYSVDELGAFDLQALEHLYGSAAGTSDWTAAAISGGRVLIETTSGADTVLATGQNTVVKAKGGDDSVIGREADDRLLGGGGNDTVTGGYGADTLAGGGGNDVLAGGLDSDAYSGETGESDLLRGNRGRDTLHGGSGDDRLAGGNGADRLVGGDGSDVLTGGRHADVFVFVVADYWESDRVTDFGNGGDKIEFEDAFFSGGFDALTVTQQNGNTYVYYNGEHEIELTGFTGELTATDFIFS
ncbi:reprolysin-like metallopeptidase [Cribrihabitans pelagius]|uniref:reprolysin-like metallopeptidase n=1 Tax=Cribrihabitans pelagius TaxID=1765746 RepID=UPI003B59CCD4